jgi:hypothetical protein
MYLDGWSWWEVVHCLFAIDTSVLKNFGIFTFVLPPLLAMGVVDEILK